MKRLFAAMTAALLMVALVSSAAVAAAPGNSLNAKACQKGGYLTLIGATGQTFATQDACVSYAAHGGILYLKIATLTSVVTGPVAGLGALVGNPQSRTAGSPVLADPAMLFTLGGSLWVPGQAIRLTYVAAAPLGYTYTDPTLYFTAGLPTAGATGSFSAFFQDNCFTNPPNSVLVSGLVPYTITGTDAVGQSASVSGTLNCDKIPATVTATGNTLASTPGFVLLTASGWHFTPSAPITLTYNVLGVLDGGPSPLAGLFTEPTTGADGSFTWDSASTQLIGYYGDNCVYNTGSGPTLQTTNLTFTMTASDGTHSATATGLLMCSLLAP